MTFTHALGAWVALPWDTGSNDKYKCRVLDRWPGEDAREKYLIGVKDGNGGYTTTAVDVGAISPWT